MVIINDDILGDVMVIYWAHSSSPGQGFGRPFAISTWWFNHSHGYPNSWMAYKGKSENNMDD